MAGERSMRITIAKCKARNAVNIVNIDKFRNEAVCAYCEESKLMGADNDLFRGSLSIPDVAYLEIRVMAECSTRKFHRSTFGSQEIPNPLERERFSMETILGINGLNNDWMVQIS